MNRYCLIGIGLIIWTFGFESTVLATDEELIEIVEQKLNSPNDPKTAPYVDWTPEHDESLPDTQKLKNLSAFGTSFSGRARIQADRFVTLSYRTNDLKLTSPEAEAVLRMITDKLQQTHGPAKLAEVPNVDDGPPSFRVFWWRIGDEVILLYMDVYSRTGVNIVKTTQAALLSGMGVGESEFWQATLQREAEQPKRELPKASSPISDQSPPTTFARPMATPTAMPVAPSAPKVAESPAPTVERGAAVWPWIVGILAFIVIVAVVLKRRSEGNKGTETL